MGAMAGMMVRVDQPVLALLPGEARSIGPSAGLFEGPEGGVVFVFGLATFTFAAGDEAGRRLAAVQLVATKAASAAEVASGFGVSTVTLWRWGRDFAAGGVAGLVPVRTGPKGPSKLTAELTARIVALDADGGSLRTIAAETGVSTATVRVALGRVSPRGENSDEQDQTLQDQTRQDQAEQDQAEQDQTRQDQAEQDQAEQDQAEQDQTRQDQTRQDQTRQVRAGETVEDGGADPGLGHAEIGAEAGAEVEAGRGVEGDGELVVLAAPVPRTVERAAARAGVLGEAAVVITEGAQLPLAGVLLGLPGLEATGLLEVAEATLGPLRNGFYGLRATLLTGVFMALLREPRAEGATRIRPADLGRMLGLDRAPEVKTLRRKLAEIAAQGRGAQLQAALGRHHAQGCPQAVGFLYLDGHVRVYSGTRTLLLCVSEVADDGVGAGDDEGLPDWI